MKTELVFGKAIPKVSFEFDPGGIMTDQSSYWSYTDGASIFQNCFKNNWGSSRSNPNKTNFAANVTSGWWKASIGSLYVGKIRFYASIATGKSWYFDLKISKDGGTTWETIGRYTLDSTNSNISSSTILKTNPYLDMDVHDIITDFKFDFPVQEYPLHVVNAYGVEGDHIIFIGD